MSKIIDSLPGDKSLSHRLIILGSLSKGQTVIENLNNGEDVLSTINCLRQLGISIQQNSNQYIIHNKEGELFKKPESSLDCGNSGTTARLLIGLLCSYPFKTTLIGDESLSKRPMKRVIEPLEKMGACFKGDTLPLTICENNKGLQALTYDIPIASAQIKSALLLAALRAQGITTLKECMPTRNHTEKLFPLFGADIQVEGLEIQCKGQQNLKAPSFVLKVPADPSSAAFLIAAALLRPTSLEIKNVLWNPRRCRFIEVLKAMGAKIETVSETKQGFVEPTVTIKVYESDLKGVETPSHWSADLIDEYPILAVVAACAQGISRFYGLSELKYKESNRLSLIQKGLRSVGIEVDLIGDDLVIKGKEGSLQGGLTLDPHLDHRIAMAFKVLSLRCQNPLYLTNEEIIKTSFPQFSSLIATM
ncbi:MAG: 3-phosphoshikimate 1-carboxyvinyltransferase [Proteobacteria bacterium]|nr:3-phosphoshikimate 1-carboxyvinyltransferase [Pseudomonadota bacterium]